MQNRIFKYYVPHSCGLYRSSMDRDVLGLKDDSVDGQDRSRLITVMKSLISVIVPQGRVPPTTNWQLVRAEPVFIAIDDP